MFDVSIAPHKAIIKISLDAYPLQKDGEINPLASKEECHILDIVYGKNLEECLKNSETVMEKWKKILKPAS